MTLLNNLLRSLNEQTTGCQQPNSIGHLRWLDEIGMKPEEAERLQLKGALSQAALIEKGRKIAEARHA